MAQIVVMPEMGESVVEGEIGRWLIQVGQKVDKDQPVVEVLTDKADAPVPSPIAGVVTKHLAAEGDLVKVGAALFEIDEDAVASAPTQQATQQPSQQAPAQAREPDPRVTTPAHAAPGHSASSASQEEDGSVAASPAIRKLAREHGVSLSAAASQAGRVGREQVLAATRPAPAAPAAAPAAASGRKSAFRVPPYVPKPGDEVIPFSRRRRIIADHMVYSKLTSPHVVTFAETDIERTYKLRARHKAALQKEGVGLTFLAFVAAATARALREVRAMNARVLEDEYVLLKEINLGIAVETEQGLVVPVIRNADELSVRGLARAIGELAEKARTGNLAPQDLAGKTFTISNPGRKGNLVGGAIISQPNVGILRVGEIKKRPVVVTVDGDDQIAIHPVMFSALSYDHRIVDGVEANKFLWRVADVLANAEFEI
jgi:2-oxoglutarate dehydrogenase E2 component (dihydrolipoamide succinyltransferase)